ncbi:MAG: secretin N-terminal domain-containing protein, partial [Planctomycetota bacterium]
GRGKSRIRIIGDDVGKQLIVTAPDEIMPEIESLVNVLDRPPTGVDIKIFPLEHAQAKEVLQGLNQMVQRAMGQLRGTGIKVDLFSASADERSNSLVVMGGPTTFLLVEKVLKDLDVPPREPQQVATLMRQLVNASAAELAKTINRVYGGRGERGVPPRAEANPSTNTLIVRGTRSLLDEIERDVINPSEQAVAGTELKDERIALTYAKADEVAQTLTQRFNDKFNAIKRAGLQNVKPSEQIVAITPEVNSNTLLVTASEGNIAYIREVLLEIDLEGVGSKSATTTEIYSLQYADPNNVANVINSAFRRTGRVAQRDRVQAVVEWATQSVVVIASAENQARVAELVAGLDKDTGTTEVREVYKLQEARASDVARVVNETLRNTRRETRTGRLAVTVVAIDTLNSLIVSGTQKDYDSILPLIQELDVPPSAEKELRMLVYPMRYADPSGIVGAINNAFRTMGRRSPADQVNATIDWGTQSVIVSASPANHEKVRALIESVDVESTLSRQLHTVKLENADAESVARTLQEVFRSSRRGTRRGEQPVSVTPDLGTNSLLITASAKEMEDLAPLIASLDVKPEFERDRIFKSFKLTFAESWGVKQMIDETFRVRGGRSANPRDMVTCMAEWGSNSLIVTASPEKMEQVEDLIAEVDQQGAGQREVHVVTIKHADPAAVNQALNEIFVRGARGRRGGETISISNPRGADTLLIKANETEFAEILAAVEALDVSEVELDQIQIVPLKHVDAADAVDILQEYLRKPGGRGGRGAELAGDMRISAASSTNALVISGDLEEIEHLTGIIAKIDVEIEDDMRAPKIIKLQYASALEIEQSLTSLFNEGGRGGRGRGGRGRGGSMLEAPTIVADEGTN